MHGTKYRYKGNLLHNDNGPAVIWVDGSRMYFLNNVELEEEDYLKVQNCPLEELPLYINTEFAPIAIRRLRKL